MALSECKVSVDRSGQELVSHGTTEFPIACYHDDFNKMNVPWHWHVEWEAVLITQGSCVVAAGQKKTILHAGQGFFINSGILHGCWDEASSGCQFHSLVFHPRLVGGSRDSVFYREFVQPLQEHTAVELLTFSPSVPWEKEALLAIENAWQLCAAEPDGYAFDVRNQLSRFVFLLHRHMPDLPSHSSRRSQREGQRIKTMLSFIHDHYGGDLSTHMIAQSACVSESECLRCFRSTIGTTPIQYLKQYRLQQAANQLLQGDDRISEIAERCGFQDMSYFTRAFRALHGCTPSAYRESAAP